LSAASARPDARGRTIDDKSLKHVLEDYAAWVRGGEEKGSRAVLIGADLHEADLRGADLTDASLRGTEVWRCNLKGCTIEPTILHTLLDCRTL
jgi:hypothetical protein